MSKFRNFEKYEVFDDGRIWSYSHKKFLKPFTRKDGYQQVNLTDNEGKMKTYKLHRVVWEAVTGEQIQGGMQCNHINECKSDNRFCNINLMTCKENINWGTRNSRASKSISNAMTNNIKLSKSLTNNPKRSKQVGAYKNYELVMTFPSASEAGRNGFYQSNVSACCNGKLPHYKGYTWRYL